jgi:putative endonuclease
MPRSWHLYVVRTVDNTLYAGIATDVDRRYAEHRGGGPRCARYLRAHRPKKLVFRQFIGSRSLALKVEYRFKQLPRLTKSAIVRAGRLACDPDSGEIRSPRVR